MAIKVHVIKEFDSMDEAQAFADKSTTPDQYCTIEEDPPPLPHSNC